MESDAALNLYESLFYDSKKKIVLKSIVSDDDSTMRALLKHPKNHKRGKLNPEIPEPTWLADPSHRTKVVAKYIFNLATLPKIKSTCTKIDAVRVKKDFGCMLKTKRDRTILVCVFYIILFFVILLCFPLFYFYLFYFILSWFILF